jgi:hypothetical protein
MATKITKRLVDAVEPAREEVWIADGELAGLFLRVFRTGIKTFVVQYRHGRGRAAPKRVYTIGRYPILTVDQARTEARRILAEVRLGGDPAGERSKQRKAATLVELAEDWLVSVKYTRKQRTEQEYRRLSKRTFSHTSEIDGRPTLPSPTWRASQRHCPTKASSRTGRWPHSRP